MKINSAVKLGTVATFAAVLLAACGSSSSSSSEASKQTLNWMENSALPSMDSATATDVVSGETLNNTNEGLLRFGKNSKVHPGVAKSYKVSKDGKTYTFNLRKSNWSNGTKVTAKDFVYAWQRTVNPKTASQYAYMYAPVKNANEIMTSKKPVSSLGIKAEGNYKVVVTLTQATSYFPSLVASPMFFPQSKAVVDKYGKKFATNAKSNVYNGPFKLTYWTGTSDNWSLSKNTKYWNAKNVKLKKINFKTMKDPQTALSQYQSGKLDATYLSGQQPKNYKNDKQYVERKGASTFYIEMNQRKDSMMKNKKARQALSLAINRKQFVNKVLADGSTQTKGLVSTGLMSYKGKDFNTASYVPEATNHDLAKAKTLWKQALKETGRSSYNLTLMADDTPAGKNTLEFVQSQWSKLGNIKVTNQSLPFKTRLARSENGQFQAVVSGWGADYPDAISFLEMFTKTNSYNRGKWNNAEYNKDIAAADGKDANNEAARWTDLVDAQKTLMKDQGIIPLYQQGKSQLVKSKVKGVTYFPTGANWDFSKAYIAK
ncbi:peptide ABC transporter substrate-binding protein [Levilactobacillus parabrevis]|uniref:ABC-type oligopeptide transport system, periplasmic component n=1 Tax=Levilactobacillus parabrevis ATCC 53295 TaxID=1267003 RepID=A0A0R1H191_9LACO|nr:peptide ABC transporter substrate-binding protein [Levilactobacillus parabrevis]KRK37090.1 ABC-type oligopeptide transport system, periplasmic component [Levilactobacillus parabrevis ATCC 53295]KRO06239.1 ABC-type oligopeptide transport system, periplasmic component [Levilactobacillus parabrevis]MCT4488425.1 peptide ABC transporter substrate-binding protein [Levilactobacillus parabrevis]MCT4490627.1 peptide ABC transporter substrate-binding protein [Levilactobacillus parabrevis]